MKNIKNPALRLLFAVVGVFFFRYPFLAFQFDAGDLQLVKPWDNAFRIVCTWDCGGYADMSAHYGPENSAFFPLFPLLIRLAHSLVPSLSAVAATVLVSVAFTMIAGVLILFLGDRLWPKDLGEKLFGFSGQSWLLLLVICIYPDSHFWLRGYSEPVFAVFLLAILLLAGRGHWLWASLPIGLISVTRPQGLWIAFAALAYFFAIQYRSEKSLRASKIVYSFGVALLSAVPFLCFAIWLWKNTGDPFHFYAVQKAGWGRKLSILDGLIAHRPRIDVAVLYLYLGLLAAYSFIKRQGDLWRLLAIFTFALADLPMFVGGFYSYVRFVSVNIGMFVLITEWMKARPRWAIPIVVWALTRMAIQVYHASFGAWVG
ncbi:MAG: hypothetical protein ACXWPM_08055 [Bdellovibrionota bacterium]